MSWSDLPADLISAIANRLGGQACLARFRSVCPSWRSATVANAARCRTPLLLLSTDHYSSVYRRVWILANDTIDQMCLPAARGASFLFASPNGWTLGVGNHLAATLLHPWTGASKSLPDLPRLFDAYDQLILRNMAWDWSPDAVVVSPGMGAFFCRLRPAVLDESWSPVAGCSQLAGRVSSITYCDGTFYLLDKRAHKVTAVDGATFGVVASVDPPDVVMPSPWCISASTLVVVSSDELHLIVRTTQVVYGSGRLFKAFRLDRRSPVAGWSEIAGDIGDRALFVDHLRGFYVEANGVNGVRRNCMYVASSYDDEDYEWAGSYGLERFTVSVLDLDTHIIEHLEYGNLLSCRCGRFWPWPSWLMPNLH